MFTKKDFEYKPYGEKTIQELDEEVDFLMEQEIKWEFYRFLMIVAVIVFIFREPLLFKATHFFPMPSKYVSASINPNQEPVQIDLTNETVKAMRARDGERDDVFYDFVDTSHDDLEYIKNAKPYLMSRKLSGKRNDEAKNAKLLPMAVYSISGRTVAINYFFDILKNDFDRVALFDIGLTWGSLSDKDYLEDNYEFVSEKRYLKGSRSLHMQSKNKTKNFEYDRLLKSHTHVIPANDNVLSALLKLKKYDLVKMDGYLVDIFLNDTHIKGSLSRTDTNDTGRGQGACEIMYVTKVQLGNFVYE